MALVGGALCVADTDQLVGASAEYLGVSAFRTG
jgi:hypothetical protein